MVIEKAKRLAVVVIFVLVAAGCGGSSDSGIIVGADAEVNSSGDDVTADSESTNLGAFIDGADDSPAVDDSEQPATLQDYLGMAALSFDLVDSGAYLAQQDQRVEELIARCMMREGFEYVAVTPPPERYEFSTPGDVEVAREHGFSVSTRYGRTNTNVEDEWIDPNESIEESLSESERRAYYEALHGTFHTIVVPDPEGEGDGSGEIEVLRQGSDGCRRRAYEEVYAFDAAQAISSQLDLDSVRERIEADPRIVELDVEWAECMAQRGHGYRDRDTSFDAAFDYFRERFREVLKPSGGFVDPFKGMSTDEIDAFVDGLSPEELDDFYAQADRRRQNAVDQEALAALQAEERALAVDFAECSDGMHQRTIEIYREYEAQIVAENRPLLEQFRENRGS